MAELTDTLALIKRLIDDWLHVGREPSRENLKTLLNALNSLKNFAEGSLRQIPAWQGENTRTNARTLRSGTVLGEQSANQARLRAPVVEAPPVHNHDIQRSPLASPSLFVSPGLPNRSSGSDIDLELQNTEHGYEQDEADSSAAIEDMILDGNLPRSSNSEDLNLVEESEQMPHFFEDALDDLLADDDYMLQENRFDNEDEDHNDLYANHIDPDNNSPAFANSVVSHQQRQFSELSENEDRNNHDLQASYMDLDENTERPIDPVIACQVSYERAVLHNYLESAARYHFRFPHEQADANTVHIENALLPLVQETALSVRLIHGLLYTLLPGSLRILEVDFMDSEGEFVLTESPLRQFAVIVRGPVPSIILGDPITETIFLLEIDQRPPILEHLRIHLLGWKEESINAGTVAPHLETTLALVYIAEACLRHVTPMTNIPSSYAVRLRFLSSLLGSHERDYVLGNCGVPENSQSLSHLADVRANMAQTASPSNVPGILIPDMGGFNMEALRRTFASMPADMKRKRKLRILQCIVEIGSSQILESLNSALSILITDQEAQPINQPMVEKLFHIHLLLDKQGGQSHLAVARSRYVKYCYFETYWLAVKALQEEKRSSDRERRGISAMKQTASYKQGIRDVLPATPHTDRIQEVYRDLDEEAKKKRATDMVKDELARRVSKMYSGNEQSIRRNITRYIREGKVLHHILQGSVCLNPAVFVIFPGYESDPPILNFSEWNLDLQEEEKRSLSKPIGTKDIEGLTFLEAEWFGQVLQCRPAMSERVPENVIKAMSSDPVESVDFCKRNPEEYCNKPLHFFA